MSRTKDQAEPVADYVADDPVGMVEDYTIEQNWNSERANEHELWAEIPGQWGNQRLWVAYHEESEFLQFNCYLSLKIPDRLVGTTAEVIALMNERAWLGHFEIWFEEMAPVFRVVLPLRGSSLSLEQVEDIMTSIVQEIERFFPAFQWVIWGGKSPQEAVAAAIVDIEGEA